jgi:erythromycin esterase
MADQQFENDPRITWLRDNAINLNSIEPNTCDFSDLQPLKDHIRDARIVLLGEQTHFDGTTFLAKTRLIKFLHQEMGFDVLAFEYGLYECNKAWQLMISGRSAYEATRIGLSRIWRDSQQCHPLIDYFDAAIQMQQPLQIAGFDVLKPNCPASSQYLLSDLTEIVQQVNPELLQCTEVQDFIEILRRFINGSYQDRRIGLPSEEIQAKFLKTVDFLIDLVSHPSTLSTQTKLLWIQILKNIKTAIHLIWVEITYGGKRNMPVEYQGLRDRQMGKNLIWLTKQYFPNRKIIGWAATIHNARNLPQIDTQFPGLQEHYSKSVVMGDHVWSALGTKMYSLGFTAYEGSCGGRGYLNTEYNQVRKIPPASSGSLEDLMVQAKLENALIDFRYPLDGSDWLREKIMARPLGQIEMIADWGTILDGLVFTRYMVPSDGLVSP